MPKIQRLILTIFYFLFISFSTFAQEGRIVRETIDAPSLRENLFADTSKRQITVYLPPSYDAEKNRTYPVVYLLHGYTGNNNLWTGGSYIAGANIQNSTIIEPCYIGPNAKIINSVVGPYVSIGENSIVESCVIKNSLIQNQTNIKNANLEEAMIGNYVKFDGSFTKISIGDYSVLE